MHVLIAPNALVIAIGNIHAAVRSRGHAAVISNPCLRCRAAIAQVVGAPKKPGELTKREAGQIIDHLSNLEPEATA